MKKYITFNLLFHLFLFFRGKENFPISFEITGSNRTSAKRHFDLASSLDQWFCIKFQASRKLKGYEFQAISKWRNVNNFNITTNENKDYLRFNQHDIMASYGHD
jgi:hypothetical protein